MNSVLNRTTNCNGFNEYPKKTEVKRLPSSYYYNPSTAFKISNHQRIRWNSQNEYQRQHNKFKESHTPIGNQNIIIHQEGNKIVKIKSSPSQQLLNRSYSTDVTKPNKANDSNKKTPNLNNKFNRSIEIRPSKIGKFESTESIIQMHRFFKEKQIYSSPNDNYKRRTIVLVKNPNNNHSHKKNSDCNNSDFGFHLQSYGLVNTKTESTEFICFVDNVQAGSSASQAGLNNGDVLLAIDGIGINEFQNLREIMEHVQGKQELRLVIVCENVCKKIQLQQRMESLKSALNKKKTELERISKQQELILSKNQGLMSSFASPLSSSNSSSLTNSSISDSLNIFPISPTLDQDLNLTSLSPEIQNLHVLIKNSTPFDTKNTSIIRPDSDYMNEACNTHIGYRISSHEYSDKTNRQKSSSSPNGTARIKCELNVTTPNIKTSTSTYSASPSSSSSTSSTNIQSSFMFNKIAHKCIQQTSRIVRSASSSSMNILSNLGMGRSSRSRNSSMCSTLNDSDISECKKSKRNKFLNKSMISDVSRTDSINSCDIHATAKIVVNNHNPSFSSNNRQPQIKQPISMHKYSSIADSVDAHKNNNFIKFNNSGLSNISTEESLDKKSKFEILQKMSTTEQILPLKSFGSDSTNFQNDNKFLYAQVSPILSNNSIDIIDSGIDVGIGLPTSPFNASIKVNTDYNNVAKIISDGGYSSFLDDYSQKDVILDSISEKSSTRIKARENSNKEFIITKL